MELSALGTEQRLALFEERKKVVPPQPPLDPSLRFETHDKLISDLRTYGWVHLPLTLSLQEVTDIHAQLAPLPVFNAHVKATSDGKPYTISKLRRKSAYASYDTSDIFDVPQLRALPSEPRILRLAKDYFEGVLPLCYSYNVWWAFPGKQTRLSRWHIFGRFRQSAITQAFHRDLDSYRFLSCFLLLTDLGSGRGGEHHFIRHSHDNAMALANIPPPENEYFTTRHSKDPGITRFYENNPVAKRFTDNIYGKAGSLFLADTFGLHKSQPPLADRCVAWFRFAIEETPSYRWDKLNEVRKINPSGLNDLQKHVLQLFI